MQIPDTLRIRDWSARFESHRTRRLRKLKCVRVPTDFESAADGGCHKLAKCRDMAFFVIRRRAKEPLIFPHGKSQNRNAIRENALQELHRIASGQFRFSWRSATGHGAMPTLEEGKKDK